MSRFFQNFNKVDYVFGDEFNTKGALELTLELFQDITAYVNFIDELKDLAPYYSKYYVLDNDRPDQVSHKIYGTTDYHWTFYLMNDNIRRQGWPLSMRALDAKVKRDFPHKFVRSHADLTGIMIPGQRAFASNSAAGGKILRRNLDLGEIIIESDRDFTVATIQSPGGGLKNEDEEEASLTEDNEGQTSEEPQKDTSKDEK